MAYRQPKSTHGSLDRFFGVDRQDRQVVSGPVCSPRGESDFDVFLDGLSVCGEKLSRDDSTVFYVLTQYRWARM